MDEGQILTVCTGNICRSPLLERVLQEVLDARWGPGTVPVRSAGTMGLEGSPMDERARRCLIRLGGDDSGFSARRLSAPMVAAADLVLTATREHRGQVARLHPKALRYAFTFREFAGLMRGLEHADLPDTDDPQAWVRQVAATAAGRRGLSAPTSPDEVDIPDPYRREEAVYRAMSEQVQAELPAVARALTGREPANGRA